MPDINNNIEHNWPQHRTLRDTTGDWPPAGCSTIHQHTLGPAMQPLPNPAKSAPAQAVGCQLFQECAVGDSVKGLAGVQVHNINSPSCIHQAGHLVIKEDQVSETLPTPPKPMLRVYITRYCGQSNWPVITWILLPILFYEWVSHCMPTFPGLLNF
uniref:Uncharacterized protein n=1 Tax=Geospiza parvula TaxID=87175 RepID=A0A8U8BFE4_GEOPR